MDMIAYVASKTNNWRHALDTDEVIEVCTFGPDPKGDAGSYAKDHVQKTGLAAYVYEVDIAPVIGYKEHKEVVAFVTAKQG